MRVPQGKKERETERKNDSLILSILQNKPSLSKATEVWQTPLAVPFLNSSEKRRGNPQELFPGITEYQFIGGWGVAVVLGKDCTTIGTFFFSACDRNERSGCQWILHHHPLVKWDSSAEGSGINVGGATGGKKKPSLERPNDAVLEEIFLILLQIWVKMPNDQKKNSLACSCATAIPFAASSW